MRATGPLLLATLLSAVGAMLAGGARADCTCRAYGRDVPLGRSACLSTASGARLAVCEMVLNNTSWRISNSPCTLSGEPLTVSSRPNGRRSGHGG